MLWMDTNKHEDQKRVDSKLHLILNIVVQVLKGQKTIMATLNDLQNAVSTLSADISVEIAAAQAAIAAAQGGDTAAFAQVVDSLNAMDASVKAASTQFGTATFTGTNTTTTTTTTP